LLYTGSGGSTPVQDEDSQPAEIEGTPLRDESPSPPAHVPMATEDDDYVSDGGEVEREVEHQEVSCVEPPPPHTHTHKHTYTNTHTLTL
jgi:hypothetical protein